MTYNVIEILQNFIVLFTAITVHEYAHGYVAYRLGDPTAKSMGRLTLNPLAHLDPLGALMMIFCRFGWAKAVPVNPYYFKDPKRGMVVVSLAGPLANLILAFAAFTLYPIILAFSLKTGIYSNSIIIFIIELFIACGSLNICFAVFNLIPFPPLDGSKILFSVLPNDKYNTLLSYERYGTIVLLLLSATGILGKILSVVINPIMWLYSVWMNFLLKILL